MAAVNTRSRCDACTARCGDCVAMYQSIDVCPDDSAFVSVALTMTSMERAASMMWNIVQRLFSRQ